MVFISGYDGFYAATKSGNVYSVTRTVMRSNGKKHPIKGRRLKPRKTAFGYLQVVLVKAGVRKTRFVHRIIAETFVANGRMRPFVNHKNGIKTDNRATNLEWVTAKENYHHAKVNGLMGRGRSILTKENVSEIRSMLGLKTQAYLANKFSVSQSTIAMISTGRNWKAK